MQTKRNLICICLLGVVLLALPAVVQAQFTFATNNGAITITGYTGFGGTVDIPSTTNGYPVTSIGEYAFYNCNKPIFVTIPNSVTNIEDYAFYYCYRLFGITIPDSVTSIGFWAFAACTSLGAITVDTNNPAYCSVGGVLLDKDQTTVLQCPAGITGSYAIPNNVTNIGEDAFTYCSSLASITIPDNVATIGSGAFEYCSSLTSVTIPNGVSSILAAFSYCTSLTNVTIGSGITNIDNAFSYCTGLTGVTFRNSVIGIHTFFGCTGLTNFTIPDNITNIGDDAFGYCNNLTSVMIGNGVTSIGGYAFENCPGLKGVYFSGNAPAADSTLFYNDNSPVVYYLPGTTGWDDFSTNTGILSAPWLPQTQTSDGSFGVQSNRFGFNINWVSGQTVVMEACTNLANPDWQPLETNTLTTGSAYFNDPQWTNYPTRLYRLRSP